MEIERANQVTWSKKKRKETMSTFSYVDIILWT